VRERVADIAFADPGLLIDGDLELQLIETLQADHRLGQLPVYRFAMVRRNSPEELGGINLRVGHTRNIELFRGIDRMYLNAYVPQLQREGGVASFFRFHVDIPSRPVR